MQVTSTVSLKSKFTEANGFLFSWMHKYLMLEQVDVVDNVAWMLDRVMFEPLNISVKMRRENDTHSNYAEYRTLMYGTHE